MDSFLRFLLRLILVPLGYLAGAIAGSIVILVGEWRIGSLLAPSQFDESGLGFVLAIVMAVFVLFLVVSLMWLVASIGILFSEMFAVRSWVFHAGNGVVSAWIGARLIAPPEGMPSVASDTFYIVAAGLAGGLVYWLVAGSSAGFFKPVLTNPADRVPRLPPPPAPGALPPPAPPPASGRPAGSASPPP